jgi:hypothetical protein
MEHATPRQDSTYRGKPLWFAFEVGYQNYDQFSYEWIIAPATPPNIYADFLKSTRRAFSTWACRSTT